MTRGPDDPGALRADLLAWLRQNDAEDGDAWYLDEGPPAVAATAPAPPPADPASDAPAPAPALAAADEAFAADCARFVADTLKLVAGQGAAPRAAATDDPAAALDALRAEVAPCTACGLHTGRTQTVFGAGSPRASVVFIGEAPGQDEDRQGEPFVGRSGQLLGKILEAIGFRREDVFICNILKCRPPGNRDPQPDEVAACEPYLQRQLAILQPQVICCLGRIAAQTLLGTDASLRRLRETVNFYAGIPVMATYHPAALLRNPAYKRDTWNDVRRLRALHDALAARKD